MANPTHKVDEWLRDSLKKLPMDGSRGILLSFPADMKISTIRGKISRTWHRDMGEDFHKCHYCGNWDIKGLSIISQLSDDPKVNQVVIIVRGN